MQIKKHSVFFLIFTLLPLLFNAQTEVEMKTQADKLFDSEQYLEATPLYLRLLSLQPRDYNYNYRYGTCVLFNSDDKKSAIKYLSLSVNDPNIVPEAYYFLGKALHLNYQFNEAIKQYSLYIEKRVKGGKEYDAEREIQMCQNGKRLMTTITDIIVYDKKEITTDKFFRVYDLKDIGGNLLVTADFQTKLDKKNNHIPLIHFPQNPSVIYYSSYGEDGNTGKDIYVRRKLPDGTWGMPQPLQGNVNTKYDEDFPYMHPDGNYLYFSSKGHNSMGGYDVFRSRLDPETNSFGPPENIDFAISSPDDDMFYVVDSLNKEAYFASARQSQTGKLYVYKVNVDRVPIQLAVVKGNFVSEIDPANKKIKFVINDYSNGEVIGNFNSNDKAVYLITFPKGGKYEYVMTIEGSKQEFRFIVSIPFMKEFKPLKQKIIHRIEEGREVVKIINLFDEEVDDPASVLAEVIRLRSDLNVNVEEFDMSEIEKEKKNKEVLNELGLGNLLLVEVSDVLQQQIKEGSENKNLINNIGNNINNLVVENAADFVRLEEQIKNKVAEANKTQNPESRYVLLREADVLIKKQVELKEYSKDMLILNDSIKNILSNSSKSADQQKLQTIAKQFDQMYKDGQEKEAIQVISDNKEFIQKVLNDNSTDLVQNLVDRVVALDEEITALKVKVDGYNREMNDLEIEIQSLQNSIYSAKKKDVPAIEAKIASKKEEIALIEQERNEIQKIIDKKGIAKYQINEQIQILQDAISNKSITTVSKEQAKQALAETEKTNSNTLTAYVTQQINELEKQDPTLKERVVISSGLKAQNIYQDYVASTKGIQDDPSLSKEDRLYKLLANERNTVKLLNKRLNEIEKILEINKFDENLNKEKQDLLGYQKEINAATATHDKQVEALLAQNGINDQKEILNTIQPGYEENKAFIEANTNLSKEEKLKTLNTTDEKLLVSIDKELATVKTQLEQNPNDKKVLSKQQLLTKLKETTESDIEGRNQDLGIGTNVAKTSIKELIEQLDPQYESRKDVIASNTSMSEVEKLQALNAEDKKFLAAIEKELKIVNGQLAKNPNDKKLQEKQQLLIQLKETTNTAIEQRKQEIASGKEVVSTSTITAKELIGQLDPQYENRKDAITANNGLNSTEKLEALNTEDKKFLAAIENELKIVNAQLAKNPNDKKIQEKQQLLIQLKETTNATIDQRNQELAAGNNVVNSVTAKELIEQLDPQYENRKDAITANNGLNSVEKLEALNTEDKKFLAAIEKELKIVDGQLVKNPNDQKLQDKQQLLKQLKETTTLAIAKRVEELEAGTTVVSAVDKEEERKLIDPEYATKIAEIEGNGNLTKEERIAQIIKTNQSFQEKVLAEIDEVENQLEENPSDKKLQERKVVLQAVKEENQTEINKRQNELEALTNEEVSSVEVTELIEEIKPGYAKEVAKIKENPSTSTEEKNTQLQLKDQELIKSIDAKIASIDKQLLKTPNDEKLIEKKQQLVELKAVTESRMEEREQLVTSEVAAELTTENMEEQKTLALNKLDNTYEKKKEDILNNNDTPLEKKAAELKLEENLLKKIEVEENATRKILSKNPFDKEAKTKLILLDALNKDRKANIEQLKSDIEAIKSGKPIDAVTEIEKEKAIEELSTEYVENVKTIAASNELSEKEKAEQLIVEEKQLLTAIEEKQLSIKEQLATDATNKSLLKEQKILESIKLETENRIDEQEKIVNEANVLPVVPQAEKEAKIKEIQAEYFEEIAAIEENNNFSPREKLEKRQTEDQKLLGQVYDAQEKIENQLTDDPSSKELKKELQVLNAIASDLEKQIESRQNEINTSSETADVREADKIEAIAALNPSYTADVAIIKQLNIDERDKTQKLQDVDIILLSKVNMALVDLEEALMNDPGNTEKLKEKLVLEAIRSDLQKAIEHRNQVLDSTSGSDDITETQKTNRIEQLDANYTAKIQAIKNNDNLTEQQKASQLLVLENEMLENVGTEKMRIQQRLDADPTNKELQKDLAVLEAIQREIENSVAEHKSILKDGGQPSDTVVLQTQIVSDVFPDYESRKEVLNNSKMPENKKIEARIKLENELLTKLQTEEKAIRKILAKNPNDEVAATKLTAIEQMITKQKELIADLTTQKIQADSIAGKTETINASDENYVSDIERLKESTSVTKNSDLAEREVIHQERIEAKIAANEKLLLKKENPEVRAANEVLKEELAESKIREENFRSGNDAVVESPEKQEQFVANLREDLLQENADVLTKEYTNTDELKEQDRILEVYESALVKKITEQEEILSNDSQNSEAKEELNFLKKELSEVQTKRRKVKITIDELIKLNVAEVNPTENRFDDPKLNELIQQEAKLQNDLTDPGLNNKEKQVIQKELTAVQKEKATQETSLLKKEIVQQEEESTTLTTELKSNSGVNEQTQLTTQSTLAQQAELEKEALKLKESSDKAKTIEEKNYLLSQSLTKQEQANDLVKEAITENAIQELEKENGIASLEVKSTLEERKRRFSIQIGELTREITELDYAISVAKKKDVAALTAERTAKQEQKAILQKQLENVTRELEQKEELTSTTSPEAMNQEITFSEEQEIASTDEYRNYEEKARAALEVEKQIAILDAQLAKEKELTIQLVRTSIEEPTEENKAKVQANVARIKEMEDVKKALTEELVTKQGIANEALPANTEESMKMQNLVKRGVQPIQRMVLVAALVPIPSNGLDIKVDGSNTYSAAKPIPVDVKNPTGLVYRVQVGAFAKPIPQNLFKQFNPVSGEKLNNGITRYMAGYFNNSKKVVDARDQIKALGYTDAFAVAYCDGKRITLAEARILEANGQCVPKGENELILEIATNTAISMGLEDTLKARKVDELTYNKAPDAVQAEPIEKHLGLFYTVQVGVFNKPVNAKTVYNIGSLMTLRLPNGQIRYSAGMFNTVDEARPKKLEAINKGVKDAFITAYYNGQRITLAEAQKLFDENGPSILENNKVKPVVPTPVEPINDVIEELIPDEITPEEKKIRVQIVSKKSFDEFPREVLNRYNSHGSFYYDETDKKVKSAIATSLDDLPQVYYFKDDVDTLYLLDEIDEPSSIISVKFTGTNLPGDFIDWLLRFNYRREFIQSEDAIELRIYRVPDDKLTELEAKLELFGLTWTKISETERELELEEK